MRTKFDNQFFVVIVGMVLVVSSPLVAEIPNRVLKCSAKEPLKTPEGTFDIVRVLFHGNTAKNSETADLLLESTTDESKNKRHNCALASLGGGYEVNVGVVTETLAGKSLGHDSRVRYSLNKLMEKNGGYYFSNTPLECVEESPDLYEKSRCVRGYSRQGSFQIYACEVYTGARITDLTPDLFSDSCRIVGGKETICNGHLESLCSVDAIDRLRVNPYQGYNDKGDLISCEGDVGEIFSIGYNPYKEQCHFLNGISYRGCKKSGTLCSKKFEWPLK